VPGASNQGENRWHVVSVTASLLSENTGVRACHRATAPGRRERNEKVAKKVEARNKQLLKQMFASWKVYSEENHHLLLKHKDKINRVRQALWTMMKVRNTGGLALVFQPR
jgi:hypothetical protein